MTDNNNNSPYDPTGAVIIMLIGVGLIMWGYLQ